jgi:RNA polymerase sigma-70 factor (ECF subfamily)
VERVAETQTWDVATLAGFTTFYDAAFDEVYRYLGRLCGSQRSLAEDLTQDTFLSLLGAARSRSEATMTVGYAITSARRKYLDHLRGAQREERRLRLVAATDDSPRATTSPAMLADLPERERAALVLRYVDDLPVKDVAQTLNLSVHATESLLARARTRLRGREVRDA